MQPSLVDIEVLKEQLAEIYTGDMITQAISQHEMNWKTLLSGIVLSLERRGTWLVFALSQDQNLLIRPSAVTRFKTQDDGSQSWKTWIKFQGSELFVYDAHMDYKIVLTEDVERYIGRLGPDLLDDSLDRLWQATVQVCYNLRGKTSHHPIFALLFKVLTGVSELQVNEILHLAKMHPDMPAVSLTETQVKDLMQIAQTYAADSKAIGGRWSGLDDFQGQDTVMLVHERAGRMCSSTLHPPTLIESYKGVDKRTRYYCPACQPAPRRRFLT